MTLLSFFALPTVEEEAHAKLFEMALSESGQDGLRAPAARETGVEAMTGVVGVTEGTRLLATMRSIAIATTQRPATGLEGDSEVFPLGHAPSRSPVPSNEFDFGRVPAPAFWPSAS